MKRLLLLAGLSLALPAWAQSDSTNVPPVNPSAGPGPHPQGLTIEQKKDLMELAAAHSDALQANPDLATEEMALNQKLNAARIAGQKRIDGDLKAEMLAFHQKMRDAMIKADPKVAPIIAKFEKPNPSSTSPTP